MPRSSRPPRARQPVGQTETLTTATPPLPFSEPALAPLPGVPIKDGPCDVLEGGLRLFNLVRREDVSGSSGTGIVASGAFCVWGRPYTVQLWWRPGNVGAQSAVQYATLADLEAIHGHVDAQGRPRTEIQWHPPTVGEAARLQQALLRLEIGAQPQTQVGVLVLAARAWLAAFPDDAMMAETIRTTIDRLQPSGPAHPSSD